MEDVLDLYEKSYDPKHPVICFDERPCQLIGDAIIPIPMKSGSPKREHYEYVRNGTCCIFMAFEPQAGKRMVGVKTHRTKVDYANFMKELAEQYPHAESIRLVQDNLNTHTEAALYETFPPEEARRILNKLRFHYTPKHASWLNMAEIEFSVFSRSCLRQRIPDECTLERHVGALENERNSRLAVGAAGHDVADLAKDNGGKKGRRGLGKQ